MGRKAVEHFDVEGLLSAVHEQDFGLRVSTNHPAGFLRIMYAKMRATGTRVHIYASKRSPKLFTLLKAALPDVAPAKEETDDQAEG